LPFNLLGILDKYDVFARVSPEDKVAIIKAFKDKGESVAMIGDGVNDVPALVKSHLSVVVGSGTDVAKEAADLILAADVMEPAPALAHPQSTVADVKKLFALYNLEYLPVVSQENKVTGFIERRALYKIIATKLMELQKQADWLEKS